MADDGLMTDLRFWDQLEGGAGERGEADLRPRYKNGADLATVGGPANLTQALLHRLFTRVGELADLGHPEYGSRLHLLVGEPNTPGNRALLKLFILEAVAQEPRIRPDRIQVEVEPTAINRSAVVARIGVEPVNRSGPLEFDFTFAYNDGSR